MQKHDPCGSCGDRHERKRLKRNGGTDKDSGCDPSASD
jgi:hypothetical protein